MRQRTTLAGGQARVYAERLMPNRSRDWLAQAVRDLEQAESSKRESRHEWACFAAEQAAEKAVKALHLAKGQEAPERGRHPPCPRDH